jgi:hypothetical protein
LSAIVSGIRDDGGRLGRDRKTISIAREGFESPKTELASHKRLFHREKTTLGTVRFPLNLSGSTAS